jgi:hypothetical protein
MKVDIRPHTRARVPAVQAVLLGTLVVGTLDILDAFIFFGLRGAGPVRILQSIAAGLLGRDAFQGGAGTAVLGLFLHFVIALVVVALYVGVSRRIPVLALRPFVCGPLYGVAVYLFMNFVVLPMSAAAPGAKTLAVVANGVIIHMLGVGLPSALVAPSAHPIASGFRRIWD